MKYTFLIALSFILCSCSGSDDDDDIVRCINSSDYQDFECINRNDFMSASGTATPQSQTIAACTILSSTEPACSLNTLPFVATSNATPTKAQIMDRLIVSHPWMAENFSRMLDNMPSDMYNLFASVTAIVIHDEIRPAFFWPETGAIYLDPDYLWTTKEQFKTISLDPDYREDFGNALSFTGLARYTKDGAYAFASGDSRTETQTLYALSALLFHELAHARDHFPVNGIIVADSNLTPGNLAELLASAQISETLELTYPLQNDILFDLAEVLYAGKTPSALLIALSADDVGAYLEGDGANDDYAYSSIHEDTAMLFEETMMKIHYDIDREIVYATPLNEEQASCADFSFDWSNINRFANDQVLPRVSLVVDGLLPGHSHAAFLANPVADGIFSWCQPEITATRGASRFTSLSPALDPITRDYWH